MKKPIYLFPYTKQFLLRLVHDIYLYTYNTINFGFHTNLYFLALK